MTEKTYDRELEAAKREDGSIDTTKLIEIYMNRLEQVRSNVASYAKDDPRWNEIARFMKGRNNPDIIFATQDMINVLLDMKDDRCLHSRAYEVMGDLSKCTDTVVYTQSHYNNGKKDLHFRSGNIDV